jgi:branched-chain amino acid transport system substrate-binding protein
MRSIKPIQLLGAVAATLALTTACTTAANDQNTVSAGISDASGSAETEAATYKLGIALPLTGAAAAYGQEYRDAAQLGVDAANEKYGPDGITLELIAEDSQATAEGGVSAMNKLGAVAKAPAVLTAWSSVVSAGMPVAEDLGFALFNAGAQADVLVDASPNLANMLPMNGQMMDGFAKFLVEDQGFKTFAAIHTDNEGGQSAADGFQAAVEELGGEWVGSESIRQDATDATTQVAKIEQLDPDFVYVQTLLVEGASVFKAIRETEPDATFGSYAGVGESRVIRDAGREAYNGLYYMSHIPEDIDAVQGLLDEIKAVNPSRTLVNQSYDSYFYATPFVYAEAIKRLREQGAPVTGSNVLAVLREATDIEVPIVGVMDLTKGLTYSSATVIRRANDYKADPMTDETVTTVSTD